MNDAEGLLVLVCGSRNWKNNKLIAECLSKFPAGTTVMHGGCRGADVIAGSIARRMGFDTWVYPAQWNKYGKSAGPRRNDRMLDEKPDLILAFHDHVETSRGTRDVVMKAQKRGISVEIFSE